MEIALARSKLERLQKAACSDHKGDENNSNKSVRDALGSANSQNVSGVSSTRGRIWPMKPDARNLYE